MNINVNMDSVEYQMVSVNVQSNLVLQLRCGLPNLG